MGGSYMIGCEHACSPRRRSTPSKSAGGGEVISGHHQAALPPLPPPPPPPPTSVAEVVVDGMTCGGGQGNLQGTREFRSADMQTPVRDTVEGAANILPGADVFGRARSCHFVVLKEVAATREVTPKKKVDRVRAGLFAICDFYRVASCARRHGADGIAFVSRRTRFARKNPRYLAATRYSPQLAFSRDCRMGSLAVALKARKSLARSGDILSSCICARPVRVTRGGRQHADAP
jgi:hypothetical protein